LRTGQIREIGSVPEAEDQPTPENIPLKTKNWFAWEPAKNSCRSRTCSTIRTDRRCYPISDGNRRRPHKRYPPAAARMRREPIRRITTIPVKAAPTGNTQARRMLRHFNRVRHLLSTDRVRANKQCQQGDSCGETCGITTSWCITETCTQNLTCTGSYQNIECVTGGCLNRIPGNCTACS
jgi:hypothetical protein